MMKNQKGSAAAIALLIMFFATIALAGVVPMVTTQLNFTTKYQDIIEAQLIAEAGAKRAIVAILNSRTDWNWTLNSTHNTFDGSANKYYVVQIVDTITTYHIANNSTPSAGATYKITSNGYSNNSRKTVVVNVTLPQPETPSGAKGIKAYGASVKTLIASSLSGTNADIMSVDAFPSNVGQKTGYSWQGNQDLSFPNYDYNLFKAQATALIPSQHLKMNANDLGSRKYFYDGDLTISTENVELKGSSAVIFVNGDINVTGNNFKLTGNNITNPISFLATGKITFNKDTSFVNAIVFAKGNITYYTLAKMQPGLFVTPATLDFKNGANINTNSSQAESLSTAFNTVMSQYLDSSGGSGGSGGSGSPGIPIISGWSNQ